jgi:iron complex outermembrane receptor protein
MARHRFLLGVPLTLTFAQPAAAQISPPQVSPDAAGTTSKPVSNPVPETQTSTSSIGTSAAAATTDQEGATDPFGDDIVVTAEKRAEGRSVQNIPISVVAVGEAALNRNLVANISEVSKLAANTTLVGSSVPGFVNFNIRGLGLTSTVRTIDPAVGVFIDGAYVGFGPSSLVDNFDIASIEVLRGPQGTLFGRNVTGGAVVVNTKRPGKTTSVETRFTAQTHGVYDAAVAFDVPLADGLYSRMATVFSHERGYFKNATTDKYKSEKNLLILRPSLRYQPTPDLTIDLIGEYQHNNGGPQATQFLRRPTAPTIAERVFRYVPPSDKYTIENDLQGFVRVRLATATLKGDWNVGPGVVSFVGNYRHLNFKTSNDFDGTPFTLLHYPDYNLDRQSQESAELRYASSGDGPLQYTVGGYFFHQHYISGELRDTFTGLPSGPARAAARTLASDRSYAAFAQAEYHLSDPLSVVAGLRYTRERKSIDFSRPGTCTFDFETCSSIFSVAKSWGKLTPKIGVNYQATPDVLAYASYTKGFRSGAFNARAQRLATLGPADPENAENYEIGLKLSLLDRRLRFNIAAFTNDVTNLQKSVSNPYDPDGAGPLPATIESLLTNAGKARIRGIDFDTQANLGGGLSLRGSLGYLDTDYQRYTDPELARRNIDFRDLRLERAPKLTYSVGSAYVRTLDDVNSLEFNVSYTYSSKFFNDAYNSAYLAQGGYGLLDASIVFAHGTAWDLTLYGKNLTNREYIDSAVEIGGLSTLGFGGIPRRFGIQLKTRF